MPRPRYENVEPERKAKLLEAAVKEFAAHGYELASINRILEAAGFSKGSFYYYFDDKADLAATVFLVISKPEDLIGSLGTPTTPDEFWAELRAMSHRSIRRMTEQPFEYECLFRLSNAFVKEPALLAKVMPTFAPGRARIMKFMQRGLELGAVRDDISLATFQALMEAVKTAAYKSMFPGDQVPTKAELEAFTDLVMDLAKRIAAKKESP